MRIKNYEPHLKVVSRKLKISKNKLSNPTSKSPETDLEPEHIEQAFTQVGKVISSLSKKINTGIENKFQKLSIRTHDGVRLITRENIISCKGNGNYTVLSLRNGMNLTTVGSIGVMLKLLDTLVFFRTHKSWIVNLLEIDGFKKKGSELVLSNGTFVSVSRSKMTEIKEILKA